MVRREHRKQKVLSLDGEIALLRDLDRHGLRQRWRSLFRRAPPLHLPRHVLFAVLAYRIQADARGDLDVAAARLLDRLPSDAAPAAAERLRTEYDRQHSALQPGTVLVREWNGAPCRVMVMETGLVWNGRYYGSLSAVAKAITGTAWNGHRFFGLRDRRSDPS